jgi:hypothetical protein
MEAMMVGAYFFLRYGAREKILCFFSCSMKTHNQARRYGAALKLRRETEFAGETGAI